MTRMQHVQFSLASGVEAFLEEFITQGGLSKLIQLMRYPKPQLNISALESVPPLLELASSLEWLKNHTDLMLQLYEKISDNNQKTRYLAL